MPSPPVKRHGAVEQKEESYEGQTSWETVFGLGADATSEVAVQKIFAAKGRPSDNPLIVHLHSRDQVTDVVRSVSPEADLLMDHFFPGPLSIILPKATKCRRSTIRSSSICVVVVVVAILCCRILSNSTKRRTSTKHY